MTFLNIIIVDMRTRMYVGGHLQVTFNSYHCRSYLCQLSLLVSLSVSMSYSVSCTKETVLGLQQVELPSHFQNSVQASCADEQLNPCEEHGLSLLQLQLTNLSIYEGATSTFLGSDTGQYAPDGPSYAHPNSSGSSAGGSCCNAAFQMQA